MTSHRVGEPDSMGDVVVEGTFADEPELLCSAQRLQQRRRMLLRRRRRRSAR